MHRKLWARLLSCYVALTVVFAGVPIQAFAEDLEHPDQDSVEYADGALYYSNSQWSYNCLRNDGYGVPGYPTWDDFNAQTRQAILESMAWQEFILLYGGYNPMRGQWVWTRPSDTIASQMRDYLQDIVDSTAEIKPYQPGGIGGGSGSSGGDEPSGPSDVPDGYVAIPLSVGQVPSSSVSSSYGFYDTNGVCHRVNTGMSLWFYIKQSTMDSFPSGANLSIGISARSSGNGSGTEYLYAVDTSLVNERWVTTSDGRTIFGGWQPKSKPMVVKQCIMGFTFNGTAFIQKENDSSTFIDHSVNDTSYHEGGDYAFGAVYYWGPYSGGTGGGTGGTVSPVPDPSTIEKPESPATPSNPQTPERDSPTIVIGGTTQTVPDPSPAPDLSTIEELLRRILANTNTIIEQMNSFASQLGQELASFYDAVYDWFGVIDTRLRDQIALLDSEIEWLEGIFDWAKSIDTDIQYLQSVCSNGFNDVVGVLRRILERMTLAGDSGGSKPGIVDPEDPSPVMDWLRQLWTSFLADLQVVLPDQVGAVVDFLDQLRQKFPFSIPWDIAAMLALLNHAPVTPVIDIPWGYAGGIEYVHVDCHAWDDAVEIVRPMFLLLFALCLALLTRDLLAGLEAVL